MSNNYLTSKIIKTCVVLLAASFLIFLNPKGVFNPVRTVLFKIAFPFEKTLYYAGGGIRNTIEFMGSISDLKNENEKLLRENNDLASEVASLSQEKNENKLLREQLDLAPKKDFDLVSSFVIGQDPQGFENWILIDKGSDDGVAENMPVIVSSGIIVGRVSAVFSDNAKVDLLTGPSSSINAVDTETNSRGIVRGEYGLGLVLGMVAQTDVINVGDSVTTSGLGSNTPEGLLIGKIKEVRMSSDKLFQEALISPRVKYSKLDVVFVVKNKK